MRCANAQKGSLTALRLHSIHGCPLEIVSDQGREFCNQLVDLRYVFKHKITSAYHPQSNGLDEPPKRNVDIDPAMYLLGK